MTAPDPNADSRRPRVLVVGINYAPEHTGISPYTTRAAEHLVSAGADVLVLTGVPHYPHWTVPQEYRWRRLRYEDHHGVQTRRLRHYVPRQQSALKRGLYEATFAAQVAVQRLPWRPDVVLAVVPSLLSARVAARIARRSGARFVVWVQDLMAPAATQSGISGGGRLSGIISSVEAQVLRRADSVLVLNEAFRRYARDAGVDESKVVLRPNWSHISALAGDPAARRRELGWPADEVVILHSGNMGLKQGLESVVTAARLADERSLPLRFVLMGDGNRRRHLEALAESVKSIEFLNPAPSDIFVQTLAAADLLLVNELPTAVDMSLPSKLTSYFRAGRPVLAAVPEFGGTAAEVRRSRAGVLVEPGDPDALVDAALALVGDGQGAARMGEAGLRYVTGSLDERAALDHLESVVLAQASRRAAS